MNFLNDLFSGAGSTAILGILALGIVIVLIVILVWLFKLFSSFTQNIGRMNNRRLNIIDSTHIDPKRKLVLIRRDDVEHLLMIGGEKDLVIETGIEASESVFTNKTKIAQNNKSKKLPTDASRFSAPIIATGAKSLRHTGLMRQANDPLLDNNPQTSAGIGNKTEPDFATSDKTIANETDSLEEEADVIISDIEEKSANNKYKRRRKSDK